MQQHLTMSNMARLLALLALSTACCAWSYEDGLMTAGSQRSVGLSAFHRRSLLQSDDASDRLEDIGFQMLELIEQLTNITEQMAADISSVSDLAPAAPQSQAAGAVGTGIATQEMLEGMLSDLRELLEVSQAEELELLAELREINAEIGQRLDALEGKDPDDAQEDSVAPGPAVLPSAIAQMAQAEAAPIDLMPIFDEPASQPCMTTSEVMKYYSYAFGGLLQLALDSSGLDSVLDSSEVSFTLFAPTSQGLVELADELSMSPNVMVQNSTLMRNILEYHVYPGVLTPADLLDAQNPIPTMQFGRYITASTSGGRVSLVGLHNKAEIGNPRVEQFPTCNGIVYLARQALIPPDLKQVRDEEYLRQRIVELEAQLQAPRSQKRQSPSGSRSSQDWLSAPQGPRTRLEPSPTYESSSSGPSRSSILSDQLRAIIVGTQAAVPSEDREGSDVSGESTEDEQQKAAEAMELIESLAGSGSATSAALMMSARQRQDREENSIETPDNNADDAQRLNYEEFVSLLETGIPDGADDERSQRIATAMTLMQQMQQAQDAQQQQEEADDDQTVKPDASRRGLLGSSSSEDSDLPLFLRMAGYRAPEPGSQEEAEAIRSLAKRERTVVDREGAVIPDLPPLLAVSEIFRNDQNIGSVDDEMTLLARAIIAGGPQQDSGGQQSSPSAPGLEQLLRQTTADNSLSTLPRDAQDGMFGLTIAGQGSGQIPGLPQMGGSSSQMGTIPEMGALPMRLAGLTGMIPGLG